MNAKIKIPRGCWRRFLPAVLGLIALGLPNLLAAATASPENVDWVLVEMNGKAVSPPAQNHGSQATLNLDASHKQASGVSFVNNFGGSYQLNGSSLKFGELWSTKMASKRRDLMAAEREYLGLLAKVNGWRLADGKLELLQGDDVLMRYSERESLTDGNTAYALDLYGRLRPQAGNLFFSPHSISTALAMTYGGARGDTAVQMAKALHFDLPPDQLHPAFAAMAADLAAIQQKGKIQLAVANSLWPQKKFPLLPDYLALCQKYYGATITPLDYAGAAEACRKTINDWVEDKTNRKITGLIGPGVLNTLTRLVLVNAIYFKGDWTAPFQATETRPAPFHVTATKAVDAPLMHQKKEFGYAQTDDLQVLELPYSGGDLSMVVLLPRKTDGLADLEARLTPQNLAAWLGKLDPQEVEVFLPKFKLTSQFSLGDNLAALGMTDAFTGHADFSGMDGAQDLFISAVVHKAFVDVNEAGTEAAAATGVMVGMKAVMRPRPAPIFRADHPFLFLIRENHSGGILFLGRLVEPTPP